MSKKNAPRVAIIGAGLAGLTAAHRLRERGITVEVFEARKRVGGRIFTINLGSRTAELGAQNISDGGEAVYIRRLIKEFGLELVENRVGLHQSYYNGESLIHVNPLLNRKQFLPHVLKKRLNELLLKARSLKEILDGILEVSDPLYKILSVKLAAYEGASIEHLSPFYSETLFHMLLGGICSAHQGSGEEESAVLFSSIKGGNALLPEKMAEKLGARVHLNMPLAHVSKNADGQYSLTFRGGQKEKADFLILAIPCSVYESIIFEKNTLDLDKLKAIQNVRYGTNAKILVPFSTPPQSMNGLIDDRIIGFFDLARTILTLYYTGETSHFSPRTIHDAYARARPMLEMSYLDACPLFAPPIYAQDLAFSTYHAPVGYSWPNDPYAKGSYSYISPGQEALMTTIHEEQGEKCKTLFSPVGRTLYFAGEHASVLMDVPGTMEAACESGERAARMILKREYGGQND